MVHSTKAQHLTEKSPEPEMYFWYPEGYSQKEIAKKCIKSFISTVPFLLCLFVVLFAPETEDLKLFFRICNCFTFHGTLSIIGCLSLAVVNMVKLYFLKIWRGFEQDFVLPSAQTIYMILHPALVMSIIFDVMGVTPFRSMNSFSVLLWFMIIYQLELPKSVVSWFIIFMCSLFISCLESAYNENHFFRDRCPQVDMTHDKCAPQHLAIP